MLPEGIEINLKALKGRNVVANLNSLLSRVGAGNTHQGTKQYFNRALPAYLGGGGPGGWASNHYAESQNVTGWAFCAVRAIARTCARVVPQLFETGERARQKWAAAKKALRRGRITESRFREITKSMTAGQSGDDAVPVDTDHPLLRLLRHPNPWMSRAQFFFQCAQQLTVTGTALVWVRRNNYAGKDGRGIPARLYCVPTGLAVPLVPDPETPYGSYRIMPIGSYGGVQFDRDLYGDSAWSSLMLTGGVLDGRAVKPVRWPHPLFLTDGQSAMTAGELWIDMANQLDRACWYGFKNTLSPGMILGMDSGAEEPTTEEAARFEAEMQARIGGLENVGKILRLPKGLNILAQGVPVRELDYIQGRESAARTVLALFSTPPVATGIQEAGAYAAYIASLIQFTEQAVTPVLSLLADDFTHELCPAFGEGLECRLPPPPVNDSQQKLQEWSLISQTRACTTNEFRHAFGLPPLDGRRGEFQVGTDWAEAGAEDFSLPKTEPVTEAGLDKEEDSGNIESQSGTEESGAKPPRPTDSGVKPRSKSYSRHSTSHSATSGASRSGMPDVPGFFRRSDPYVPSGVFDLGRLLPQLLSGHSNGKS